MHRIYTHTYTQDDDELLVALFNLEKYIFHFYFIFIFYCAKRAHIHTYTHIFLNSQNINFVLLFAQNEQVSLARIYCVIYFHPIDIPNALIFGHFLKVILLFFPSLDKGFTKLLQPFVLVVVSYFSLDRDVCIEKKNKINELKKSLTGNLRIFA